MKNMESMLTQHTVETSRDLPIARFVKNPQGEVRVDVLNYEQLREEQDGYDEFAYSVAHDLVKHGLYDDSGHHNRNRKHIVLYTTTHPDALTEQVKMYGCELCTEFPAPAVALADEDTRVCSDHAHALECGEWDGEKHVITDLSS